MNQRNSGLPPESLRLIALIADDGYAASFQSMGQYRTALIVQARANQQAAAPAAYERTGWFIREGAAWVTSSDDPRATILYRKATPSSAAPVEDAFGPQYWSKEAEMMESWQAAQAQQAAPAGWTVKRDDLPQVARFIIEDRGGARSVTEEAEPTLFRYFQAVASSTQHSAKAGGDK